MSIQLPKIRSFLLFGMNLLTMPAYSAVELFPEDGSERMGAWHTRVGLREAPKIAELLEHDGIELKVLEFGYEWLQDLFAFDRSGALVLQADYPDDEEALAGLTLGIGGLDEFKLFRVSGAEANSRGYRSRTQSHSLWEGGELITGRFRDGEPYAIIDDDVLDRLRYVENTRGRKNLDETQLRALVAKDLVVSPNNLFFVQAPRHLDLFISALPGGRLVIEDQRLVALTLRRLLSEGPVGVEEKARLARMLDAYENGLQRHLTDGTRLPHPLAAHYENTNRIVDQAVEALAQRFEIIRAPGMFKEPGSWDFDDRINFFNGFMAQGDRQLRQFTNVSHDLPSLEREWQRVLQSLDPRVTVEFVGNYRSGAGLDCSGLPGPKAR